MRDEYARVQAISAAEFASFGLEGAVEHTMELDMRFVGQAFESPVRVDTAGIADLPPALLAERFAEEHRRMYLHGGEPGRSLEIVGLRFGVRRRLTDLPRTYERPAELQRPASSTVAANGQTMQARVVEAASVGTVLGPALVERYSSTTRVPPGWIAARDDAGSLLLQREGTPP